MPSLITVRGLAHQVGGERRGAGVAPPRQAMHPGRHMTRRLGYRLGPWIALGWIFFDHPPGRSRIRNAMAWKREHGPGAR
jgi:hypothetical protein